jgi:hypothetical protein
MAQASRRNFPKPLAPARFKGWQERPSRRDPIELWNLTHDIPGHPAGSTVTRETIEKAGLYLPAPPEPAPNPREPFELTPETISMIVKWVEQHRGDTEGVARWMRDALHIGGIRECRQIVTLALGKDWIDRMKRNPRRRRRNPVVSEKVLTASRNLITALKGQANRAFASAYLQHLMEAKPEAPDHRVFHVASDEAVKIRRDLATITGSPYPNPCVATNPRKRRTRPGSNPPRGRTVIYTGGRIRGTWYGRHRNGKLYKHKFGGGSKAVYGLPDGSIQIVPAKGRLWGMH